MLLLVAVAEVRKPLAEIDSLRLVGQSVVRAAAVADMLADHPSVPVVLDPVLVAAGGAALAEETLTEVLLDRLVPAATLVTPNALEIRRLGGESGDRDSRARALLRRGCRYRS